MPLTKHDTIYRLTCSTTALTRRTRFLPIDERGNNYSDWLHLATCCALLSRRNNEPYCCSRFAWQQLVVVVALPSECALFLERVITTTTATFTTANQIKTNPSELCPLFSLLIGSLEISEHILKSRLTSPLARTSSLPFSSSKLRHCRLSRTSECV